MIRKRTFALYGHELLFKNNTHNNYYFEIEPSVLATLGTQNEDEFYQFISRFQKIGAVAVSMDMSIYMNVSQMPITREMLNAMVYPYNQGSVHLVGARVYIELDKIIGDNIPELTLSRAHPGGLKAIYAIHKAGRERLSWSALQAAFTDYGVDNLILPTEMQQYLTDNGYVSNIEL